MSDPILLGAFGFSVERLGSQPLPPIEFAVGGPAVDFEVNVDGIIITIEPLPNPN